MTDSKPSKSERKREHLALQELGEKLIALTEADLSTLSLDETLLEAVRDAAAMKSRGWRDRMVRDGTSALDAFEIETTTSDPELRRLIREFQDAFSDRDETTVRRKIFRRIHEILVRIPQ